jgi:predicted HNH restriction endonuclease
MAREDLTEEELAVVAGDTTDDSGWFFINTDATSLGGRSPHDAWFEHGMAFAGGPRAYGERLGQFQIGDTLLMWANGLGVVGVGTVVEPWDGLAHDQPLVYVEPHRDVEYRRGVHWFADLRDEPITRRDIGWNPVRAVQGAGAARRRVIAGLRRAGQPVRPCFAPRLNPGAEAYARALRAVEAGVNPLQRALLVAQYEMPGRMATVPALAEAVGQGHYAPVNASYGGLGRALSEALGFVPYRWDGTPQWWNVLSWCPREKPAFVWQMQPPLARALEELGWVRSRGAASADEVPSGSFGFIEGAVRRITVNAYERDARAREACIASRQSLACEACGFDFEATYGELGRGFIHVHHVKPLHTLGTGYEVDPVRDLALVCPNCHAMLHRESPAWGVEALRGLVRGRRG